MPLKKHPTIGCCGIDCGLCPRYYTAGGSRCPGCGGEGFDDAHPPCGVKKCCAGNHGLEACGQCAAYPCQRYEDREKMERDSFVTHKRMYRNHEKIKADGIERFMAEQGVRVSILKDLLANFDDGRAKGFYCLSAALLSPEKMRSAMAGTLVEAASKDDKKIKAKALRAAFQGIAEAEGVELKLLI